MAKPKRPRAKRGDDEAKLDPVEATAAAAEEADLTDVEVVNRTADVHLIEFHLGESDLRSLATLAGKALSELGPYRSRIATWGDGIGINQHAPEIYQLVSTIAQLAERLRQLSAGTCDIPTGTRAAGLLVVLAPELEGTDQAPRLRCAIQDLDGWLRRYEAQARGLLGRFPTIDDREAGIFADVVVRLVELATAQGPPTKRDEAIYAYELKAQTNPKLNVNDCVTKWNARFRQEGRRIKEDRFNEIAAEGAAYKGLPPLKRPPGKS